MASFGEREYPTFEAPVAKKEEKKTGIVETVKDAALNTPYGGLAEYTASAATGMGAMVPGGLRMLRGFFPGERLYDAIEAGKELSHKYTYEPRGRTGKMITDAAHKVLEVGRDYSGKGAEYIAGGSEPGQQAAVRTLGEVGFDAAQMFIPLGAAGRNMQQRNVRQKAAEVEADARRQQEIQESQRRDTSQYRQDEFQLNPPEEQIIQNPQGFTGGVQGGILNPRRIAELEAELNPPVEARGRAPAPDLRSPAQRAVEGERRQQPRFEDVEGQGELFTGERPYPEAFPGEGVVGAPVPSNRQSREVTYGDTPPVDAYLSVDQKGRGVGAPQNLLAREAEQFGGAREMSNMEIGKFGLPETPESRVMDQSSRYVTGEQSGLPSLRERQLGPNYEVSPVEGQRPLGPRGMERVAKSEPDAPRPRQGGEVAFTERSTADFIRQQRQDHAAQLREAERVKQGQADALPWTGSGSRERGSIGVHTMPVRGGRGGGKESGMLSFGKAVTKKGPVEAIKDFKHLWTDVSRKPLAEYMSEKYPEGLTPEIVKDIAPEGSKAAKGFQRWIQTGKLNFLIDRQMAILSQGKGPMSDIIKWVVDGQNRINRELKTRIEENTNSALEGWRALKQKHYTDVREMLTTWQKHIGKDTDLVRTDFKNERQWNAYQAVHTVITDLHERTNEARAKADPSGKVLKQIHLLKNYFPSVRNGDWWMYVHDNAGNLKAAYAYPTRSEANRAYAVLKKDMGKEFDVKEPALKKISEHDLSSLDAYEETLRALHRDDPVAKAIAARYNYLLGTRGFGRHALKRRGVEGALGFEQGKLGVKNAEKVLESYITRGETYIANLERAGLERQVAGLSETKYWKDSEGRVHSRATLFENAPLGKQYVDEYLARSKGKDLDLIKGARMMVDTLSVNVLGTSYGAIPRAIQKTSSLASLFYLATARNALVQLSQPINTFAKFVDMKADGINVPNPVHAMFDGYLQMLGPDALAKEGKQWAIKNGYLESAIVGLIEGKLSDFRSEGVKLMGDIARWSLGKIEQHAVRTPVFYAFEKSLRKDYPNKLERFEMAANLTDNYMVHYDRESSPLMYDKMGSIFGESSRGLKTYSHNTWGQFFEYVGKLEDKGQATPLATFIGTQALVGGLRGVFLVAEATAMILALNAAFGLDIPTPSELLLKAKTPDWLVFGGLSTILGADVSASVAAPNMPQFFNFVPIEFAARVFNETQNYLIKRAQGKATDADLMKAMLAVSPNAMRGWIEYAFSKEGGMIPNPYDNMKGNFPVPTDDLDQLKRFGLGFRSLDEAKRNLIMREHKRIIGHDMQQKLEILDIMTDSIANGKPPTKEMLEQYIKEGGSMQRLMPTLQRRLAERQLDYEGRLSHGQTMSPGKAHKLEELRKLMDDELEQRIRNKQKGSQMTDEIMPAATDDLRITDSNLMKQTAAMARQAPIDNVPIKNVDPESNYANFEQYRQPHVPASGYPTPYNWNLRGAVDPKSPGRAWVFDHDAGTHGHEVSHVDQLKANKRLGKPFNEFSEGKQSTLDRATKWTNEEPRLTRQMELVLGEVFPRALIHNAREVYAYAREIESRMPAGKHIWEHPAFKPLFEGKDGPMRKKMVQELMFPEHQFADTGPELPKKRRNPIHEVQRYIRKATQ